MSKFKEVKEIKCNLSTENFVDYVEYAKKGYKPFLIFKRKLPESHAFAGTINKEYGARFCIIDGRFHGFYICDNFGRMRLISPQWWKEGYFKAIFKR